MSYSASQEKNYLNANHTVKSWLLTVDHKRIALLYLISITFFFIIGGTAAALFRTELLSPRGWLFSSETYNRLFTAHGVVMVFLFLVPSIPVTLGNFLVPMMIGAKDLAFPRLNLASWYIFMAGGALVMWSIVAGGLDTGWTFYTPYSTIYAPSHVAPAVLGVFVAGFSSIFTGLNFIVTIHRMRAPGLTWGRLPIFLWAQYATSLIYVLATPVLAVTVALLAMERCFGIGVFDPARGGDPILMQHLFWFYSHPAVYIMILPAMGVVGEIIPCFSRRPLFGYKMVAFATLMIALIGFLVWGHHMFVTGQSVYAGLVFSMLSFVVAIPSAIKVFNWTATMYKGHIRFEAPMIYSLGFIGLFTIGGLTGLFLASPATDVPLHDTYFVVAHFHYVMVGGAILGYMAGLHFWWPKITGRMYPEFWAKLAAGITFVGFNLTFFPQFIMGFEGLPRRYHIYPPEFQILHVLSTAGSSVLALGYLMPAVYFIWSLYEGAPAPDNPWLATGLEWKTASPPPTENFKVTPVVTEEVYAYDKMPIPALPGGEVNFVQH